MNNLICLSLINGFYLENSTKTLFYHYIKLIFFSPFEFRSRTCPVYNKTYYYYYQVLDLVNYLLFDLYITAFYSLAIQYTATSSLSVCRAYKKK